MKKKQLYHPGKLKVFAQLIARIVERNPGIADNPDLLYSTVVVNVPQLAKKETCANCTASMVQYDRHVDLFVATLVKQMGEIVKKKLRLGEHFTDANKIQVNRHPDIGHVQKNITSQAGKLGLIAPVKKKGVGKNKDGTPKMIRDGNQWCITDRGWAALNGKPIPRHVIVFRNQIIERFPEDLITFHEVFANHTAEMKSKEDRGKTIKAGTDHRESYIDYDPTDWVFFAGFAEGEIV